ncbi:MAG: hypothetical protein ACPGR8_17210, partial [Limisphaerales bacterium]
MTKTEVAAIIKRFALVKTKERRPDDQDFDSVVALFIKINNAVRTELNDADYKLDELKAASKDVKREIATFTGAKPVAKTHKRGGGSSNPKIKSAEIVDDDDDDSEAVAQAPAGAASSGGDGGEAAGAGKKRKNSDFVEDAGPGAAGSVETSGTGNAFGATRSKAPKVDPFYNPAAYTVDGSSMKMLKDAQLPGDFKNSMTFTKKVGFKGSKKPGTILIAGTYSNGDVSVDIVVKTVKCPRDLLRVCLRKLKAVERMMDTVSAGAIVRVDALEVTIDGETCVVSLYMHECTPLPDPLTIDQRDEIVQVYTMMQTEHFIPTDAKRANMGLDQNDDIVYVDVLNVVDLSDVEGDDLIVATHALPALLARQIDDMYTRGQRDLAIRAFGMVAILCTALVDIAPSTIKRKADRLKQLLVEGMQLACNDFRRTKKTSAQDFTRGIPWQDATQMRFENCIYKFQERYAVLVGVYDEAETIEGTIGELIGIANRLHPTLKIPKPLALPSDIDEAVKSQVVTLAYLTGELVLRHSGSFQDTAVQSETYSDTLDSFVKHAATLWDAYKRNRPDGTIDPIALRDATVLIKYLLQPKRKAGPPPTAPLRRSRAKRPAVERPASRPKRASETTASSFSIALPSADGTSTVALEFTIEQLDDAFT